MLQSTEQKAVSLVTTQMRSKGYQVTDANEIKKNTKYYDLVCKKEGIEFFVNVKGHAKAGPVFRIKDRRKDIDPVLKKLWYVCVHCAPAEFFIASQADVNRAYDAWEQRGKSLGTSPGLNADERKPFKNRWDKLPGWV